MKSGGILLCCVLLVLAGCGTAGPPALQWESMQGPAAQNVSALCVDEKVPARLYAGLTTGEFFQSPDEGRTWKSASTLATGARITRLLQNPDNNDILFAATEAGLFTSSNRGKEWRILPFENGVRPPACPVLVMDPWKPSVLYAGTRGKGVMKTTDGGMSWRDINSGGDTLLARATVHDLKVDPSRPDFVYAAVSGLGLIRSTDAGATWKRLTDEFSPTSAAMTQVAVHPRSSEMIVTSTDQGAFSRSTNGGQNWSATRPENEIGKVIILIADPANPDRLVAGTEGGIIISTDFGSTWSKPLANLPVIATRVAFSSAKYHPTLYAFGPGIGLQASPDEGKTWRRADQKLGGSTVSLVKCDDRGEVVYAVTGSALLRSGNNPGIWEPVSNGLRGGDITSLAFDVESPSSLFATTPAGAFKSVTGGSLWQPIGLNLRMFPSFIETHPWIPTRLLAAGDQGVFVSTDRGNGWVPSKPLGNTYGLTWATFTPTDAGIIHGAGMDNGMVTSHDGGLSWEPSRFGLANESIIVAVTMDDQDQQTYFAWTARGECYRSINRGLEWNRYSPAWNTGDTVRIAFDRLRPSSVVALVNGHSVLFSPSGGTSWFTLLDHGPHLEVVSLYWNARTSTLHAGTRNDGVYRLTLARAIRELSNE